MKPCSHPGCLSHITHPCEVCGRTAGRLLEGRKQKITYVCPVCRIAEDTWVTIYLTFPIYNREVVKHKLCEDCKLENGVMNGRNTN